MNWFDSIRGNMILLSFGNDILATINFNINFQVRDLDLLGHGWGWGWY